MDLEAITANVGSMRDRTRVGGVGPEVMAVVKAGGYGHGMVPAARAALRGGASWLGVAFVEEALSLREAGIDSRILCLLGVPGETCPGAVTAGVDLSANAPSQVAEIAVAARQAGCPARVHLKVDTGLSRGGATPADWPALVDAALAARAEGNIDVVGVWSHLARADEPGHASVDRQVDAFRAALEVAEKAGVRPEVRHLANSAATLTAPQTRFDMVRPGIAVYGLCPVPGTSADYGLRPAMTLRARLALVKKVPAGSGVSYGHRYVTDRETTLGLVPLGYADGVPRHAGDAVRVLAAGRQRRIAGTVCMDQFVIDLGEGSGGSLTGDEVLLFGPGDHGEPTAGDWAEALGTISYEIVTGIGSRVARTYVEEII